MTKIRLYSVCLILLNVLVGIHEGQSQCSAEAGTPASICSGSSTTIGGSPTVTGNTGAVTYAWTPTTGLSNPGIANPTANPTSTTTYTVTISGAGCNQTVTDQVTVTVLPTPTVTINATPSGQCATTPVNFTSSVTNCSGCQYSWNFGDAASGANNASTQQNPSHTFQAFGNGNQNFTVSLTVTAANGCTATQTTTVTVKQVPQPVLLDPFSPVDEFLLCDGQNAVGLDVADQSVGNITSYTINWGDASPNWTGTTAPNTASHTYATGIFTLAYTLAGQNGCTSTKNFPVYNISNPSINVGSNGGTQQCAPANFCFNLDNFAQNHPSTTYTLSFGDGSPSFTVDHANLQSQYCHSYSTTHCPSNGFVFTVEAVNGCASTPGTVGGIKVGLPPDASFTASPSNQCVNIPITFTNTSSSGVNFTNCNSGTQYIWTWGDNTPNTTVNSTATQSHTYTAPGTYNVTLQANHTQCGSDTFNFTVCVQSAPTASIGVNDNIICVGQTVNTTNASVLNNGCSNVNGTWSVTYSDLPCDPDNGSYTFAGGTSASSSTPQFTLQSAGVYTLTYTVTSACPTVSSSQSVTVNTVPVVSVSNIGSLCTGQTITPSGSVDNCNTPITTYAWSFTGGTPASFNGASPPAITYATAGNYTASFTATNECGPTTATAPVQVLPPPVVSIVSNDANNTICSGSSVQLTANNAGTYSWTSTSGGGLQTSSGATVTAFPTATTTYTVVGSAGSCSDTETITINVTPIPTVTASGTFALCQGSTLPIGVNVAGGTAPYSNYVWNNASTLTNAAIANPTTNTTASFTYSVQVTDANGCVGSGSVPVTVNTPPAVNAGPDIQPCNQPVAVTLTGFSPAGGTWSGTGVTAAGQFTPGGVGCNTLTYTFTNPTTGCTGSDQIQACVTNLVPADAGADFDACLNGAPFSLPGTGTWSGCGVVSNVFNPAVLGPCTLTYTLGTGSCQSTDQAVVTVRQNPTANAGPDVTICAGQTVNLNATGTPVPTNGPITNYVWSGGTVSNPQINNPTITPTSTVTLNVTVVDQLSCSGQDQMTIFVNPLPVVNAGTDVSLCNQPIATPLTGFSPAGGTWTGPGVTAAGQFTPSGIGSVTLTYSYTNPATSCTNSDQVIVTVNDAVVANAGPDVSLCLNQGNFSLAPPVSGGTWNGTGTGAGLITSTGVFSPTTLGAYTLTYSIGQGTCLTTDQAIVTVNPLPDVNAGTDQTICIGDTATMNGFVGGGTAPFVYSWSPNTALLPANSLTPQAFPSSTTTYTITVTDARGCTDNDAVVVTVNSLPVVEAGPNLTLCNQPIAETLTGYSASTPGTGTWSGPGITDPSGVFTPQAVGTFTAYYTFTAGGDACANVDSIEITVVPPVIANAGSNLVLCLNDGLEQLQGFSPAIGAVWSGTGIVDPSNGVFNPELAGAGTYTLTLSYGSGTCFSSDNIQVIVRPLPSVVAGPDQTVCGNALPFLMTGFTPATGGIWEGAGITDAATGLFDPSLGAGIYPVFIRYTDPVTQCSDSSYKNVNVSPVPVANFSVAPLGCTNANIDVTNSSSGGTTYAWNYGNGATGAGFDPPYVYPDEGIFDIRLVVTNAAGCRDTAFNSNEIIDPPTAVLTIDPAQGCAPLQVSFGNNSIGQYVSYLWDLAIGSSADTIPAAQTYLQGADVVTYPISLTVTNFCGTSVDNDVVTVFPQPVAGFGTNLDVFCSPFEVLFNDISTGNPDSYEWNFGDGTPNSFLQEPGSHFFFADTIPVDYTIWLYLENECGRDTANYTITVLPNTVTAFFNTNITEGCSPLTVEFTDFSDGATQIWYDLGDNTTDGNDNPVHTYTDPGEYCIYQFVDNGCSYDTTFQCIQVFASPTVDFSTEEPNVCENAVAYFISEVEDAVEMEWDFGDGGTSQNSQPSHVYTQGGNYTVTLTGIGDNGCTATVSRPYVVYAAPSAEFSIPDQVGCSPFNICFSNISGGGNFYTWNYGDGNTSGSNAGCHTYTNDGAIPELYTVSLIAQNMQLCADTFSMDIIVSPQPTSAFTLSSFESCYAPQVVAATNFSQYANDYTWTLNGDAVSVLVNGNFLIEEEGEYEIALTSANQFGCSATSSATYSIHPLPTVDMSASPTEGCVPLDVQFVNNSTGAVSYQWNLGDGTLTAEESPEHTYNTPGLYPVSLIAITDEGCRDTLEVDPMIKAYGNPVADFVYSPDVVNIYDPLFRFTDISFDAFQRQWFFGDGGTSAMPQVAHTFGTAGTFPVTLRVWNIHGCPSQVTKNVTVEDIFDVYVPNAFTPDGDGINEIFQPIVSGKMFIANYKFEIFDRWGTVIFYTNDPDEPWLGEVREGAHYANEGVYNWRMEVILKSDERREFQGHVVMVR